MFRYIGQALFAKIIQLPIFENKIPTLSAKYSHLFAKYSHFCKQNPHSHVPSLLGIGFLQQGAPEFIWLLSVTTEVKFVAHNRQFVIHDHLFPFTKTPEVEAEHTLDELRRNTNHKGTSQDVEHQTADLVNYSFIWERNIPKDDSKTSKSKLNKAKRRKS